MKIEKAKKIGLCFGVSRAVNTVEELAREKGSVETLGAVCHNNQVIERLAGMGVRVARSTDDIRGKKVVTSSHGISPQLERELRSRGIDIVSTTCPFVQRAQAAARRLAEAGFYVVIFGEAEHPEVKGLLGWAGAQSMATLNASDVTSLARLPRRLGIIAQTTQIPANFKAFVKQILDADLPHDWEMRIIDTLCHDIRERQAAAVKLAGKVNLMLVVGGHHSANTTRLAELCSELTETHHIETAADIQTGWLKGKKRVGVTGGSSTDERAVNEVVARLEELS